MPKVVLKDHYVILGVDRNATFKELQKQYRNRIKQLHPDTLGPDASAADRDEAKKLASEVTVAYNQLRDSELRKAIDLWLIGQDVDDGFDFSFRRETHEPVEVPEASQHQINGIWCWVEFSTVPCYRNLRAVVTVQLVDLFRVRELGPLPHDAWLQEVIAVDKKGDIVGRSYSIMGLRYNVRRLQAEARRNEHRRIWRAKLADLEQQADKLAAQRKPIDHLRKLLSEGHRYVESGVDSLREATQHDTVVRAIREIEKEIGRAANTEVTEVLLSDLLSGAIRHPDLAYNQVLLGKLRVYEFRSGGDYQAPTQEDLRIHYRKKLTPLTDYAQVRQTDLKIPDDEPDILELVREGSLELAPDTVLVQGNKGKASYKVEYGYAKVDGKSMPVGIIVVSEKTYERNGAQYGRASQFPALPHGIRLLIRVQVNLQDRELLSDPYPDGKMLQNEVARCRARLRNPKELEDSYATTAYLIAWPQWVF